MNDLLSFAERMLNEHGEFHPFGGYVKPSGAIVHVGVQSSPDTRKARQKVDALIQSFKKLAMQCKAVAFGIVTDVKLPRDDGSKSDAIKFFLEHQKGYCAEVYFRYGTGDEGNIEFGDVTAQQGEPLFFANMH